ncbi:MAG: hypothetical protein WBX20_19325 [Terrimicrobiaceae bacterium]
MKELYLLGRVSILFFWCLINMPQLVAASILSELTSSQKCQVEDGSQVVVTENIEGKPWPRTKVYRLINASPEQVMAVFFDYENAKSFVPNVIKSEISNRISACTMDVDYGLDVPIFPDEYYTVRNNLKMIDEGTYCIDWKLLRSVLTKDSVGNIRVEPWADKAIICYQNLVTPASNIAILLRGKAIEQMKETTKALADQVEKEKSEDPPGLKRQVAALRAALKDRSDTRLTKY